MGVGESSSMCSMRQNVLCSRRFSSESAANRRYPSSFCEWLAGIIDGDGYLRLGKEKYPELSITMGSEDFPLLHYVKETLGTGGIYEMSGAKAYRYIISNREGMIKVIQCINGLIRNSVRLPQLRRVCAVLDIPFFAPLELTEKSNWFSGFFDADGTVGIYAPAKRAPWLRISITNKHRTDLEALKRVLGGHIYYTRHDDTYKWQIESRKDVLRFLQYSNSCQTFKSRKSKRFNLIEEFFKLKDERAYRLSSPHYQDWQTFKRDHFLC